MVAISTIFPIVVASWAGAKGADQVLQWSARSLGASDRALLWEVVLPSALPQILTGVQVALPIALIVTLATEFIMGGQGLGGEIIRAQRDAESLVVFAGIVSIGLVGFVMLKLLEHARRRLLVWHQEEQ